MAGCALVLLFAASLHASAALAGSQKASLFYFSSDSVLHVTIPRSIPRVLIMFLKGLWVHNGDLGERGGNHTEVDSSLLLFTLRRGSSTPDCGTLGSIFSLDLTAKIAPPLRQGC